MQTKCNAALRSLSFSKGNKSALPCFTETCIFVVVVVCYFEPFEKPQNVQ